MASSKDSFIYSAHQLLAQQLGSVRPTIEHINAKLFPDGGPKPQSLIEISGTTNCGKSLLLWQLMAQCLPPTFFGGKYCDIVLIDLNHKFNAQKFRALIQQVIHQTGEQVTECELNETVQKCLDSVTYIGCYDPLECDLAFDTLEDTLIQNENIALVAVDALCEFYWFEAQDKRLKKYTHYKKNIAKLKDLCQQYNVCCAYTVNRSFIEPKPTETSVRAAAAPTIDVDYRLKIELLRNGCRLLNGFPITIDASGIHITAMQTNNDMA